MDYENKNHRFNTVVRKDEQCKMLKASCNTPLFQGKRNALEFTTRSFFCSNRNIEWVITLMKNSYCPDTKFLSLKLYLKRSNVRELEVFFKCSLIKKASQKINSVATLCSLGQRGHMLIPNFVPKKVLSPNNVHLYRLSCEIYALPKLGIADKTMQLPNDLNSLLREGTLADVTLVASGKELKAHKAILAARSPVFARMFQLDMLEARENHVRIDDIEYEVLRVFLGFAYTGYLEGHCEAMATDLIVAAEKYQFEELKKAAADLLLRMITVSNAIDILQLTERYNFTALKAEVIAFINRHAKAIVNTPAFKALTGTQAHLIAEIYSGMAQTAILT